jgi:Spy/CpxP family protein refolding chaperone
MISTNRHKILVWCIVLLALLNISTFITIGYHVYQTKQAELPAAGPNSRQLETDAAQFSGRYFRDQLGLTDKQMSLFRDINSGFRLQAREITIHLAENRKEMLGEMVRENSDTVKLNQLSSEIGTLHGQLKVLTYNYYLDIKHISTPEQRKKLEKLFGTMFNNDAQMGFPGKGEGGEGNRWRWGKNREK